MLLGVIFAAVTPASAQEGRVTRADGQEVRYRVFETGDPCGPTIIHSHGLGGGIDGPAALARHLARQGWRVIAVEHSESGPGQLRQVLASGAPRAELARRAGDREMHAARLRDLDAVMPVVTANCRPRRLVLMGHSMGAGTTMIEAGARPHFGITGQNRFDAYVAISPQGVGFLFGEGAWRAVNRPVLMMTGTRDEAVDGDWRKRLPAFEGLPPGGKRLAVLDGATHMDLSGRRDPVAAVMAATIVDFLSGRAARQIEAGPMSVSIDFRDR